MEKGGGGEWRRYTQPKHSRNLTGFKNRSGFTNLYYLSIPKTQRLIA